MLVDSKSEDDRYNYLDACQTMDGVWVVSQFPSRPVTLEQWPRCQEWPHLQIADFDEAAGAADAAPVGLPSGCPTTTKVVEENCIFWGIDCTSARGYAPSRYQAGSAEMLALWGEQPVTPDSGSWIPKAVRHAL